MAIVKAPLFRWRAKTGQIASMVMVVDNADFDQDSVETELAPDGRTRPRRWRRVMGLEVNCPRGVSVRFGAKGRLKSEQYLTGEQVNRSIDSIDFLASRITEEGVSWDFTPDHETILPGSVSNPAAPLTTGGNTGTNPSDATAAFTPTANALLIVAWGSRIFGASTLTYTFTNTHAGSGAWAETRAHHDGPDFDSADAIAHSQVGASPGSGTITNTYGGGNPNRKSWIVTEVTGHDTTTPISESTTGTGTTSTTPSLTLGSIAAGNLAISAVCSINTTAITPGTNETELTEAASDAGANNVNTQIQYGTDTTQDWSTLGAVGNTGVAIEYAASGGAAADVRNHIIPAYFAVNR